MQFKYTAINNENKKLSGFINADSEDAARGQLNNLGLAVLSIEIVAEEDATEDKDKLKFEALDKNGRKIIGTIPETEKKKAYKRLREEYSFQVLALYSLTATEEEKTAARQSVEELKADYELIKADEGLPDILTDKEKEVKTKLLREVEFVVAKVNEILEKFGDDIKPEDRKSIEAMEDKLLRLKNSNNLEFIKQTCEELLKAVQSKEIYLHQDAFVQGRERIKLETQKLLLNIHKLDTTPGMGLFDEDAPFLKSKLNIFKKDGKAPSPRITEIKTKLKEVNSQIVDYIKLWIKASKSMKPEVKSKLSELRFERKELRTELKSIDREEKLAKKKTRKSTFDEDLIAVTGWLLGFYLFYYFLNYYLTFKHTILNTNFDWQVNIFTSPVFTYLILGVFLLHISLQTKRIFWKESRTFNYVNYPLLLILIILVNINF